MEPAQLVLSLQIIYNKSKKACNAPKRFIIRMFDRVNCLKCMFPLSSKSLAALPNVFENVLIKSKKLECRGQF